eukprot:6658_1
MSGQRRVKRVEEELISESEILGIIHINKNMDEDNVTRRWFKINKKGNSSFMLKKSDTLSTIKTKFRNSVAILLIADNFIIGKFVEKLAKEILQSKQSNIDDMKRFGARLSNLETQMGDLISLVKKGRFKYYDTGYNSDPSPTPSLSPLKHKNSNNKKKSKCDIDLSTSQTPSLSPIKHKNKTKKISKKQEQKESDDNKNDQFEIKGICDENQTNDGAMRVEIWVPGDGHCAALCNSIGVNEFDDFKHLGLNFNKLEDIAFRKALDIQAGFPTNLLTKQGDIELRRLLNEDKRGLTRTFDGLINRGDWDQNLFDSLILLFQAAVRYNAKFYDNSNKLMVGQSNQVPIIVGAPTLHVKLAHDHFAVYCIKSRLIEKKICTICGGRVKGNFIVCGTCELVYDETCILNDLQRADKITMKTHNYELSCRQCSTFSSVFSLGPKQKKLKK